MRNTWICLGTVSMLLMGVCTSAWGRASFDSFAQYEDTLQKLALHVLTDSGYVNRERANAEFVAIFEEALGTDNSFAFPFDSLVNTGISIVYPSNRSFRIITWQLCVNSNDFRYFGYIQPQKGKLIKLDDRSDEVANPSKAVLSAKKWYGARYYNMHEYKYKGDNYYLLFGFDANTLYTRKKLIEVLQFKDDGTPTFGAPIFKVKEKEKSNEKSHHRFILEYASSAVATLNYSKEHHMIVYDNLIEMPGAYQEEGFVLVPDGSYRGLQLSKGEWESVINLYNQVQDTPPMPAPILGTRKGDNIFGNKGKPH